MCRMFANIYLYLPLIFSNCVTRHVVECDKLWFQPEIICNAVCEECLQISIYIYPLCYQMMSHDMLLGVINSEFGQKSFVMLMSRCFAKLYLYFPLIFSNFISMHKLHYFLKLCLTTFVVEYDELRFQPVIICNAVCEQCLQISIYISHLFPEMVSHDMLLSMINYYFSQKLFVMLYAKNVCKYLFIFHPLVFSDGITRHVVEYDDKLRFQMPRNLTFVIL